MRFFWLPLSTMNCNREPFTHICEWKRRSPSSGSSGSFFGILVMATVTLGLASMIYFPLSFPLSSSDSGSEHASDSEAFNWPPVTSWSETHLCYKCDSCGTHTTFLCPSLALWCCSFLAASTGCLGSPHLGFVLWASD